MLIGILQTGPVHDSLVAQAGTYPDMFRRFLADRGLRFQEWSVMDMEFPDSVHDAQGWLITGSKHGVYEDHAFIPPLEDFIRRAYDAAVPVVGVCFGHQLIAQALGGTVEKYQGGWTVGPQDYDFQGQKLRLHAWHQDQVVKAPAGAEIVATQANCAIAALRYGDRAFSVQPHPEFVDAYMTGLIEKRGPGIVPDPLLRRAAERMGPPPDSAVLADRIADFFKAAQTAHR